jgi:peptide deformylase
VESNALDRIPICGKVETISPWHIKRASGRMRSMAKVGILQAGNEMLRMAAGPVPQRLFGSPVLHDLVSLMQTAMRDAPGVGLAAPQIGVPLQVIVLEDTERLMSALTPREKAERARIPIPFQVWINPSMRSLSEEQAEFYEGCLSIPGFEAKVRRFVHIEVTGLDETGKPKGPTEMRGWPARIIQHELDHLSGSLYVDRMDSTTFSSRMSREKAVLSDLLAALQM